MRNKRYKRYDQETGWKDSETKQQQEEEKGKMQVSIKTRLLIILASFFRAINYY